MNNTFTTICNIRFLQSMMRRISWHATRNIHLCILEFKYTASIYDMKTIYLPASASGFECYERRFPNGIYLPFPRFFFFFLIPLQPVAAITCAHPHHFHHCDLYLPRPGKHDSDKYAKGVYGTKTLPHRPSQFRQIRVRFRFLD